MNNNKIAFFLHTWLLFSHLSPQFEQTIWGITGPSPSPLLPHPLHIWELRTWFRNMSSLWYSKCALKIKPYKPQYLCPAPPAPHLRRPVQASSRLYLGQVKSNIIQQDFYPEVFCGLSREAGTQYSGDLVFHSYSARYQFSNKFDRCKTAIHKI